MSDPDFQLSRRLGYLFKHAQSRLAELNAQALAPFGINAHELGVLILLAGTQPSSQRQAAERLGVDRTTMVAVLDTLERKGLVSRHPDVHDRRRNLVQLTASGQETVRRAREASDEAERTLLAALSSTDAERLREALQAVVATR